MIRFFIDFDIKVDFDICGVFRQGVDELRVMLQKLPWSVGFKATAWFMARVALQAEIVLKLLF